MRHLSFLICKFTYKRCSAKKLQRSKVNKHVVNKKHTSIHMKKILFSFCLTVLAITAIAQEQTKPKSEREERRDARREKINTLIRQQEEGALVFNKQNVFGFRLNTDGWSVLYERGYMKNVKTTNLFALEIGEKKHPKEQKLLGDNSSFFQVGNPYVYGKRNSFYQVKPTYGQQRLIGGKTNKNGVAVHAVYAGGISIGLERPYYISVRGNSTEGTRDIKYSDADSSAFLSPGNIVMGTGLRRGWNELKIVPGLHAKAALRFDYGRFNEVVLAIEVGINVEAYTREVEIMLRNSNKQVFVNGYIAILLGKRK